ncbi:RrF2 family transcriptional regulator [Parafilimonas sp.]|uniref:RrF2 family transcriptional regulator n=1 Tax=Parafilimonas sp. TaxID=1969739 RepID=UPI0039E31FE1
MKQIFIFTLFYLIMNNIRLSTSIHIMCLLAYRQEELLSSDYIASSININPAVVRKEISYLKKHNLVESKEGKGGGNMLGKPAKNILLSDIYKAVLQQPALGKTNDTNPKCPVGKHINKHLKTLYAAAELSLLKRLEKVTLSDFIKQFR